VGEWYEVEEAIAAGQWHPVMRVADRGKPVSFAKLGRAKAYVGRLRHVPWPKPVRIIRVSSRGREVVDG
jgi:hypothetical protein